MFDRIPESPGRVKITPENGGAAYYATMERADNPVQEGTPLNKETLLTDETAALFGLDSNAVPNDVFAILSGWELLQKYDTAGTYSFAITNETRNKYSEIGACIIGAGGQGGAVLTGGDMPMNYYGGNSGDLVNVAYNTSDLPDAVPVLVGAGGSGFKAGYGTGRSNAGGASSFNGVTADGGAGGFSAANNYSKGANEILQTGGQSSSKSSDGTTPVGGITSVLYSTSYTTIYFKAWGKHDFPVKNDFDNEMFPLLTSGRNAKAASTASNFSLTETLGTVAEMYGCGGDGGGVKGFDGCVLVYGRRG